MFQDLAKFQGQQPTIRHNNKGQNNSDHDQTRGQNNRRPVHKHARVQRAQNGAHSQRAPLNALAKALPIMVHQLGEQRRAAYRDRWQAQHVQ